MVEKPRHINKIIDEINESLLNTAAGVSKTSPKTIGDIIDILHERGFGILIFMFALPMALPLPVPPGMNLLFAVPLLFLTFQQILAKKSPWLPQSIAQRPVDPQKLSSMLNKSRPFLDKLSIIIRPRLGFMTQAYTTRFIGMFGVLFALCVCIPIPMTNTVPSFAILLMALGILIRDGLAIMAGIFIGTSWIVLLATLGVSGFKMLLSHLM